MAPRTVLAPIYNERCVVRPESAVMSTGGRARTPALSSRGGAPSGCAAVPLYRRSRVTTALSEFPRLSRTTHVDNIS